MKNFTRLLMMIVWLLFGQLTSAQIDVVVPNALESTTTSGTFIGPLGNSARSYQLLINASELTSLVGTNLNGIAFRSIASASTTWPSSDFTYVSYDIYLSASVAPADRSLTFTENIIGTKIQVRSGSLDIQANSYGTGGAENFGPTITFDSDYLYEGGHLLIEIRHTGSTSTSRSVESVLTSNSLYFNNVSAAWGSGYESGGGTQGNAAVVRFSASPAETVAVTSIEVSTENDVPAEITNNGGTLQLVTTITPTNATNQNVIWSIESGSEFAAVNQDGLVTALSNGIAVIRATSQENEALFDEIEVTINYIIAAESIVVSTLDELPAEITTEGGTLQLIATILPSNADNQEIIWSVSEGDEFASVDPNGLVTAIANGTATIRATWADDDAVFGEIEVSINALSVQYMNLATFNYYPNPTNAILYFSSNLELSEIIIFNILGQKIKSQSFNSDQGEIDFSALENGNYILKIISKDKQTQNHIITKQ